MFEPKFPDQLPDELRTSHVEYGMFHWQIRPASSNPWIEKLLEKVPQDWPPSPFLSLIEPYRFCSFEVGPRMFFANSGHELFGLPTPRRDGCEYLSLKIPLSDSL